MMKTFINFPLAVIGIIVMSSPMAICDEGNTQEFELDTITHTYIWQNFSVSNKSLKSIDGRYLFKQVFRNGAVELIYLPCSEDPEVIIVEPKPSEENQSIFPKIFAVESSFKNQSAIIRELVFAEE